MSRNKVIPSEIFERKKNQLSLVSNILTAVSNPVCRLITFFFTKISTPREEDTNRCTTSNNCDLAATFKTCCYNTLFKNTKQIVLAHRQYILMLEYTWALCAHTQPSWQTASWSVSTCIRICICMNCEHTFTWMNNTIRCVSCAAVL